MVITEEDQKILQSELFKLSREATTIINKLLNYYYKNNYPEILSLEDLPGEIWAWISGYENFYKISTKGRIKSFYKNKETILKQNIVGYGYLRVHLCKNKQAKDLYIHRLVAETFIPNPENLPEVDHWDGNKLNNCVENLRWVTSSENKQAAIKNGSTKIGTKNRLSKLTADDVRYIRSKYIPYDKEYGANALARKFNVSLACIQHVINRVSYRDVE